MGGNGKAIRGVLWALVLIGVLASLRAASHRNAVERANRGVEIALDYTELRNLAAAEGVSLADVLKRFHDAGATSVALQEETVANLEDARLIRESEPDSRGVTLFYGRPETIQRIQETILAKTKYRVSIITPAPAPVTTGRRHRRQTVTGTAPAATLPPDIPPYFTTGLRIAEPPSLVRGVGLGLPPEAVKLIHAAHLGIVGRVNNWEGVSPSAIQWTLAQLARDGASTVIFSGDEVLGYKGFVSADPKDPAAPVTTASAMASNHLYYGTVEFGKMKGDPELAKAMEERLVRVHTVNGAEMQTAEMPGNIQRFLLAARERDIRLLYVRLFLDEPNALATNADDYVAAIANGLQSKDKDGKPHRIHNSDLVPKIAAHGYMPLHTGRTLRILMGLGVAAGWVLLVDAVMGIFSTGAVGAVVWAITWLVAAALLALPAFPGHKGIQLTALAAGCIFPSLALLRNDLLRKATGENRSTAFVGIALLRFVTTCAVTLLGVAFIVGLLADRQFLLKIDAFMGIKLAKILPLLLVAVIYGLGLRVELGRTWSQTFERFKQKIIAIGSQPLILWQVAAAVLAFVVLALVMLRSGNDPGIGVSASELKLRALLDRVLPTRPRFQEFLIGHPAMILSLILAARGWRTWAYYLFLVGAIGQVSLLNTFCHLHTPLAVEVWRAGLGIGIGLVIALILSIPLRYLPPAPARVDR